MTEKRNDYFSYKLMICNFILSCMVVMIHSVNYSPKIEPVGSTVFDLGQILSWIGNIAVPCFFTISGFLFFYKFEWNQILSKFKRRIKTLLIPFVIWNTFVYLFYVGISGIDAFKLERVNLSVTDYISAVMNSYGSPMWYIRTLVVYVLVAPVIIWFWKKEWVAITTIVLLIASNYAGISTRFISNYYLPIYLLGAYMALYHPDFIINKSNRCVRAVGTAGILIVVGISGALTFLDLSGQWLYTLRLLGVLSFWFALDWLGFNNKPNPWIFISFPIYAMHCMFIKIEKCIIDTYLPHTDLALTLEYFILPVITVCLIIGINYILSTCKFTRKIWKFMLGSR